MRIADSTATRFTTGSEPGRPRQIGQTWVLGAAPNSVGQPQNILSRSSSSTCTSSPSTGSKRSTTSSKSTASRRAAVIGRPPARHAVEQRVAPSSRAARPRTQHRPGTSAPQPRAGAMICSPTGSPSSSASPHGHRHAAIAGEVGRDRREVVEVHRQRVVHLVAHRERRRRRRGRDQHVDLLERRGEVAGDQRAHLLRLAVVGVVVARRQRVRAEDDPALDLGAEPGLAGQRHDLLGGGAAVATRRP